ncbi:TetR/AcrR family transcriptional regulator [Mycobacterium sp. 360MFTsu5.1]|uniref:TetR/AcrR family transcriptional regulator n=1 Tax=Mycobacterium sp. 360MFTsu5.1 TaxID=1172186 RepID=UPI000367C619|nr:TetR/AcrR family transcriptional regulator [Mycobacterium sp. 360MFTsu5.1]
MTAAAKTFREKGYRSSTIDDIALAAGISRPTVYKYTRTKQHLLDLIVDEMTKNLEQELRSVQSSADDPVDRLRKTIMAHIQASSANRTFYAIVFSEETELSEAARKAFRSWAREQTKDFAALLDQCLAAQPVANRAKVDTRIAANLLESMLATLYRWYDPEGSTSPERLAEQIWMLVGCVFEP